ncbi:type I secretion system permease/ATPase [Hephaestia sp. GCM10023244]|uniref:type I secretion system permease/ATPase n=1 Tax=unclassified Hephaestia TaxID=2631281 RepID=UPI002076E9E4|nr:type I secretion system permease/ATPase [Hephaestia sp. MAHUQ-44]MCM8732015.1 type I secretion system permease/ATPase [Hephaestia sp. MAHUQ-44]
MTDHSIAEERKPRFARWLTAPMLRNKRTYLKVAAAAALINIFGLVTSLFSMTVYDRVIPNHAMTSLAALSIGFVVVIVFDFVLRILRSYFVDMAGADIDHDVGASVFERLMAIRLDMKRGSVGALAGLMRELETLRDFFASATMSAIVDVPFIFVTLAFIAAIGGKLVLVPLVLVPIVILTAWATQPAMDRLAARAMNEGLLKQTVLVEAIGALETVKTSGAGGLLGNRWRRAISAHSDSSLRQRLVSTIAITVSTSANSISYAGVIVAGVFLINDRELTTGGLVACSILSGRAVAPLASIAQLLARMTQARTAYRQINGMMEQPSEGPQGEALQPARFEGRIDLRNVEFRYPDAAEKALDGISFSIAPGERVALIGRVGSGKSTIARLILGLYTAQEGLVMIDGTDIRQFDPAAMRRHMGVAMQDSVLLSGSVRENIALERPGIDDAEMLRASHLSGTHHFMGQLANGYDLKLADRGDGLSGGQRQSIAIARALAGGPPILVFDEPTSAMDQMSESQLIDRLQGELQGKTMLLITHRPSLLKLVDRVIIIDKGKVAGDGPRDKVLQQINRRAA